MSTDPAGCGWGVLAPKFKPPENIGLVNPASVYIARFPLEPDERVTRPVRLNVRPRDCLRTKFATLVVGAGGFGHR